MTNNEAVEFLDKGLLKSYRNNYFQNAEKIDMESALEIAISAIKKQIPIKYELSNNLCHCPNCGRFLVSEFEAKALRIWEMPHCKYCGQALDWSDK